MKEERLAILKLLENGVINAEEAEKLLIAIKPTVIDKSLKKEETFSAINEKIAAAGGNIADMAKKVGQTIGKTTEAATKKAEPVLKKAAEKIGEKTEDVCTTAKNYVERKKAEREKSFVPDIDDKDFECVSDVEESAQEDNGFSSETDDNAQ